MITELLNRVDSYLLGKVSLQHLEEWLLSNLQSILDSGDNKAVDLANKLDADLVEVTEGLIDESAIREYLQRYVSDNQTLSIDYIQTPLNKEATLITASTTSVTVKEEFLVTLVEDYRFREVFG